MLWPFEEGAFMGHLWVIWLPVVGRKHCCCSKVRCAGRSSRRPGPPGHPGFVRRSPVVPHIVPAPFPVSRFDGPAFPSVSRAFHVACAKPRVPDANRRASCEGSAPFVHLSQHVEPPEQLVPPL